MLHDFTDVWTLKKNKNLIEKDIRFLVASGRRWGMAESSPKVQTSSNNISKYWGYNIQPDDRS